MADLQNGSEIYEWNVYYQSVKYDENHNIWHSSTVNQLY